MQRTGSIAKKCFTRKCSTKNVRPSQNCLPEYHNATASLIPEMCMKKVFHMSAFETLNSRPCVAWSWITKSLLQHSTGFNFLEFEAKFITIFFRKLKPFHRQIMVSGTQAETQKHFHILIWQLANWLMGPSPWQAQVDCRSYTPFPTPREEICVWAPASPPGEGAANWWGPPGMSSGRVMCKTPAPALFIRPGGGRPFSPWQQWNVSNFSAKAAETDINSGCLRCWQLYRERKYSWRSAARSRPEEAFYHLAKRPKLRGN